MQYVQAWADSVDFANKKVKVEDAIVDPRQGLGLTASSKSDEGSADSETQVQREKAKGKMFDVPFDKLVIGVGCYLQTFGTPGVKEHAYFLKDVGDARKIRRRLLECFEMAAMPTITEQVRKQLLTFAIVGYVTCFALGRNLHWHLTWIAPAQSREFFQSPHYLKTTNITLTSRDPPAITPPTTVHSDLASNTSLFLLFKMKS